MARKRMIDPEFWSDEEIGNWSFPARLFYIGLWNFADDSGRFKAHNDLLKAQIFPYDKRLDIDKLKKELNHKIQWYEVEGLQYGYIRNFLKHQRIDKPTDSRLPLPPPLGETSAKTQRTLPPNIREEKRREEKLREDNIYADFEKSALSSWNSFCDKNPSLSKIKEITDTRRKHLKERFVKDSFKDFKGILRAIEQQPFLIRGNPNNSDHKDWKVSFDWLIENDTNYIKVLEFRYKNKKESDIHAADPDCQVCSGTGWAQTGEGERIICRCRLSK